MTKKIQQNDQRAFEESIIANAVGYRVHLFLGRGEYDRADASSPEEAFAIGAAMQAAHPQCQARPMVYAIEPSGHSTIIAPPRQENAASS